MAKLITLLCLTFFASQSVGFSWWNDLRVWWTPTPTPGYIRLPRNLIDAKREGWINTSGDDCYNGGAFNGFRWVPSGDDRGIGILIDVNGFVGGFQTLLPHDEMILENGTTEWGEIPHYQNYTIDGIEYLSITVYFTNPELLCQQSESNDGHIGANSQIFFQSGFGTSNLTIGYKYRDEATANGWTVNQCVPGMGWHNFYRVDTWEDYDCNRVQPTCLLFNEFDELFGFCLTYPGTCSSKYYEHPPPLGLEAVLGDAPECLLEQTELIGATTIHIYFNNAPWNIGC